ncbi:hypothetical protein [Actinopolymorpha alba]|uniref:hypothetical protein n=1 Tax=Actinopolymorpha alba TaxID=533267 RepID=UPI0004762577|nr:hypothetical protein [Actinopolymorpha alba]
MVDITGATHFLSLHGRLLDRRRLGFVLGHADADAVVAALAAYRNADGGFAGVLEPDLRTLSSQPVGATHAFDVLAEVGTPGGSFARETLDWLESVSCPDGGLPFVLPTADDAPHAPWWTPAPQPVSSLHMTAEVAAAAYRLAEFAPDLREHDWLRRATDFCWQQLVGYKPPHPVELRFVVEFLDAVPDHARATDALDALRPHLPTNGILPVEIGAEGEQLTTMDLSPWPASRSRKMFEPAAVERDLATLETGQRDDGGWTFDWASMSPAVDFETRGLMTVRALRVLHANARLTGTAP